ncbi:urea ABC transporter permease subunit UrtB [Roseomonas terrae]|jgi:urea transport system permease protein|uniref:Urea ABC transporter permease subunit UrtB n=1 Tax=Neoroseomonas terrae TaxID=424799 RepID=A0ABS5EQK8_9PROT|nr:urea ABC transporter permease subunit UrtB [Neoroseomonas terrae]MBR0652902.1 urea ABC transporter permease subunit UrtB [Neoroseomonas terrae]
MTRIIALLLLMAAAALPARAQDAFLDALPGLGGNFTAQAEAVDRLGAAGDPRALPVLRALSDGRLVKLSDGTLLVRDGAAFTNAATGAAATPAEADTQRISINNRVRVALRGALGRLQIISPDAGERLAAAEGIFRSRSADNVGLLETALARETVPRIRDQIALALAVSRLVSADPAAKMAGITALGGSASPEARSLLLESRAANPDLAGQIDAAIADIDRRLAIRRVAETAFQGLSLGSVLLLAALGLAVTFGVMGVINMAHGEFVMLGAYTTVIVQDLLRGHPTLAPWSLPLAIPAAFLVTAAIGAAMERGLVRHLYGRPLETLLMTFGVGMMIQQAVRLVFGAQNREVISPPWMQGTMLLPFDIPVTANRLWILCFSLVVFLLIVAAIRFTRFGLEMRAVTQRRPIAAAMGIRTGRVDALTFAFGSGIAGIAGVALSQIDNVSPNLGTGYIIDSFLVVVFGGVGSLAGTLIAAFGLGVINKMLEPWAGAVLAKVFVLVAVMVFIQRRPRGLFPQKGRAAEA